MNVVMRGDGGEELSLSDFISPSEGVAHAGEPLPPGVEIASREALVEALREIYDPEIPVNIFDLGLIYRFEIAAAGDVAVEMSLTAPACPVAGELPGAVARALAEVEGVGLVSVALVWDPPWTPERMSEDAKLALDMY